MTDRVHLSPPDTGELEESYVLRALRSGWVAPIGPDLDAFEREIAARVGRAHALAVSSGTAALHLALLSIGVGPGQAVVVPTLTFAATANAVVYTGAEPVFVDCDLETGNIDCSRLRTALSQLRSAGRRVGAVIPVDLYGSCANYASLLPICESAGIPVIEDAAEALGTTAAGSFGVAAAFSFNGNKIMTTSGGGMLVSDDAELIARCRYLATQARQPVPQYEHTDVGYNYRLSNVLAALGRAQLCRLDEMIARRVQLRERYRKLFAHADGVRLLADEDQESNCWLTTIVVDPKGSGWTVTQLAEHLASAGIETRPMWKPMHLQPVFATAASYLNGAAEHLYRTGLNLPSGSAMTDAQIERVLAAIEDFLERR